MKYSIILLLPVLITLFSSSEDDKLEKDDYKSIKDSIYIESIDSILSKEYIFYIIEARNQKSEPIKLMSYTTHNNTCESGSIVKEKNTYNLYITTLFGTTYFNELDCFVIDSIEFCRDSIYNDIYGTKSLKGLCLIEEE